MNKKKQNVNKVISGQHFEYNGVKYRKIKPKKRLFSSTKNAVRLDTGDEVSLEDIVVFLLVYDAVNDSYTYEEGSEFEPVENDVPEQKWYNPLLEEAEEPKKSVVDYASDQSYDDKPSSYSDSGSSDSSSGGLD